MLKSKFAIDIAFLKTNIFRALIQEGIAVKIDM